ncbi:MAG: hypothetical protein N3B18_00685, partial [Desulfobacterota bacterium]|nr:hypothetical protein [Thermodesulfobacteriota bacterium]
ILDILKHGIAFTNNDPTAKEMLADFKDHKIGMKMDVAEVTLIIKDGVVSLEQGMLPDCHAAMEIKALDVCGAIDNSFDLMEIRDKGTLIKGDRTDPNTAVHFMATFPFFDAMVRLYNENEEFKNMVDQVKASL